MLPENTGENATDLVNEILANENDVKTSENIVQTSENTEGKELPTAKTVQNIAKTVQKKSVVVPNVAKTVQKPAKTLQKLENIEKNTKQRNAITINFSDDEFAHVNVIIAECKHLKTSENNGEFVKQCIDFAINHDFVHKTLLPDHGFICFATTEEVKTLQNKLFKGSIFKGSVELEELK